MDESSHCILCAADRVTLRRGVIAPFLADRIWKQRAAKATLVQCGACSFQYFIPRLSEAEERRLYDEYRGSESQQKRFRFEPWYTPEFNAKLFSEQAMDGRRQQVAKILHEHLPENEIHRALDFGGAKGELLRGLIPGAQVFVYDISSVEPLEGVKTVELNSGLKSDLVVCSNVFEHVASPRKLLQELLSFAAQGSYVFIEVPDESPAAWKTRAKRLAQLAVLALSRPTTAFSMMRSRTLNVMHEHLNFYSQRSLRALFEGEPSLQMVDEGKYGDTIWILGQVRA
jgi:2-polyprenyl-3-methyl-5-hydroxy-6-metoxy-1,4-benzoquinol methylase